MRRLVERRPTVSAPDTAPYHAMLHPSTNSDVNGEYMGSTAKAHKVAGRVQYAKFICMGYISQPGASPITMLLPKIGSDIAESLVVDAATRRRPAVAGRK